MTGRYVLHVWSYEVGLFLLASVSFFVREVVVVCPSRVLVERQYSIIWESCFVYSCLKVGFDVNPPSSRIVP